MSSAIGKDESAAFVFGEVLLDEFPDGRSVVGGAPFNVAWNLHGLGSQVEFLSAVGRDAPADRVQEQMDLWGLSRRGLQVVDSAPTGRVSIELKDGQPSYTIEHPAAYDFIGPLEMNTDMPVPSLLYYGTLALRDSPSRETLTGLLDNWECPRFFDVNIREPWFSMELVADVLPGAKWVKLNDQELGRLADVPTPRVANDIFSAVSKVRQRFGGETYLVTCGDRGAYAIEGSKLEFASSPRVPSIEDTVGAGDAFSASFIHYLGQQATVSDALAAATRFAAKVCGMRGATSTEREFYQRGLESHGATNTTQ